MRYIFAVIIALFLFFPSLGFAQTKEIISEGTYNMGDGETPGVAESRALLQAKRIALEQAGPYVESYTKIENRNKQRMSSKFLHQGLWKLRYLIKRGLLLEMALTFA